MNTMDIDEILSAVTNMNNGDNVQNILSDLQHRTPSVQSVGTFRDNNSSSTRESKQIERQSINRPVDPATSASSSDDTVNEASDAFSGASDAKMKQMLQSVSNAQSHRQIKTHKMASSNNKGDTRERKGIKTFGTDEAVDELQQTQNDKAVGGDHVVPVDGQKSHMSSLLGYNIPTSTLYFIIVLVIIAVGLYFLTAEKKRDKDTKNKKKDSE